jgi:hypothetical protein
LEAGRNLIRLIFVCFFGRDTIGVVSIIQSIAIQKFTGGNNDGKILHFERIGGGPAGMLGKSVLCG